MLGWDGYTSIPIMAQERSWSEYENTRKWWALRKRWRDRWVGSHFYGYQKVSLSEPLINSLQDRSSFLLEKAFLLQGEKNCGNWSLCLICSARQKWDERPTGILGVTLSQQVIQTWAAFYPVWSGTGSLPTCPALKLKELREWGNCLGEPDQGRTRIENGC